MDACPQATNFPDNKGFLPIHHCCSWRISPEKLDLLLQANPDSVNAISKAGETPLSLVLARSSETRPCRAALAILRSRINSNLSRPSCNYDNHIGSATPMVTGLSELNSSVPNNGKDVRPSSSTVATSLTSNILLCVQKGNWQGVIECIWARPADASALIRDKNNISTTILHKALASPGDDIGLRIKVIKTILDAAPTSASLENGYKTLPLHVAARNNYKLQMNEKTQMEVFTKLIQSYPEAATSQNTAMRTPLHIACAHYCPSSIINILIKAGPEATTMKDKHSFLPIHLACRRRCSVDKLLLLLNANPDSIAEKTRNGDTLLCLAATSSSKIQVNDSLISILNDRN